MKSLGTTIALCNGEKRQHKSCHRAVGKVAQMSVSKPEVTVTARTAGCSGLGRLEEKGVIGAGLI